MTRSTLSKVEGYTFGAIYSISYIYIKGWVSMCIFEYISYSDLEKELHQYMWLFELCMCTESSSVS